MKDDDMGFVWICSSKFARMVREFCAMSADVSYVWKHNDHQSLREVIRNSFRHIEVHKENIDFKA